MHRHYYHWFSPNLNRDMELLVFGHAGARVLVFPTRFGRFFDYEDFGLVEALTEKLEAGHIQLLCVDSVDGDSLYSKTKPPFERIQRHIEYEKYILEEVLPLSRRLNPQPFMIAHGCSFGAFHAVNIALRHPQWFGKIVALSGRYDLSTPVAEFRGLFEEFYNEDIYYHTPNHFVPNLHDEAILDYWRRMEIVMAVGDEDPFLGSTQALSAALWAKHVTNEVYIWEGRAHKAEFWQKMVQLYL